MRLNYQSVSRMYCAGPSPSPVGVVVTAFNGLSGVDMRNCRMKSKSQLLTGSLCFCCQVCSSVAANDSRGSQD